jgi:hypothetical protein
MRQPSDSTFSFFASSCASYRTMRAGHTAQVVITAFPAAMKVVVIMHKQLPPRPSMHDQVALDHRIR